MVYFFIYFSIVDEPLNLDQNIQPDEEMQTEQYQTDIVLEGEQ